MTLKSIYRGINNTLMLLQNVIPIIDISPSARNNVWVLEVGRHKWTTTPTQSSSPNRGVWDMTLSNGVETLCG